MKKYVNSSLSISFKLSERRTWGQIIIRWVKIGAREVHVFTACDISNLHIFLTYKMSANDDENANNFH